MAVMLVPRTILSVQRVKERMLGTKSTTSTIIKPLRIELIQGAVVRRGTENYFAQS